MDDIRNGPELAPPTISLLTAANIVPDTGRWELGFDLVQEGPERFGAFVVPACPIPDNEDDDYEVPHAYGDGDDLACTVENYQPFVIYVAEEVSTFGAASSAQVERVKRKLLTAEPAILEEQLWLGTFSPTDPRLAGDATTNIADVTEVALTATSAWEALAVLEQTVSEASATRGMYHARPKVIHELLRAQTIRRVGNVYLTPLDNIVVPGRGYPGTGPDAEAVEWMFGHPGIVEIRRGEIDVKERYDHYTNNKQVIASRVVHVALNSALGVWAIDFTAIA